MIRILFTCLLFAVFTGCGSDTEKKPTETVVANEAPAAVTGQVLFKRNCAQCHMPDKDFIGPSLVGVEARWKSKDLLYKFIKNSEEVIKTDPYAKELFIKWKEVPMLPNPQLTDADIDAILSYTNGSAATK